MGTRLKYSAALLLLLMKVKKYLTEIKAIIEFDF
jgi:hypothetical protein